MILSRSELIEKINSTNMWSWFSSREVSREDMILEVWKTTIQYAVVKPLENCHFW